MMRVRALGALVAVILAGAVLAGCGGGVDEGLRKDAAAIYAIYKSASVSGASITHEERVKVEEFKAAYNSDKLNDAEKEIYASVNGLDLYYLMARVGDTDAKEEAEFKKRLDELKSAIE